MIDGIFSNILSRRIIDHMAEGKIPKITVPKEKKRRKTTFEENRYTKKKKKIQLNPLVSSSLPSTFISMIKPSLRLLHFVTK